MTLVDANVLLLLFDLVVLFSLHTGTERGLVEDKGDFGTKSYKNTKP